MEQSRRVRKCRRVKPRAHRACVSCKEKKLKCDDQTPECANCSRLSITCLFEDPETKKRRPRNYLEALEARVALLESPNRDTPAVTLPSCLPTPDTQQPSSSRLEEFVPDERHSGAGNSPHALSLQAGFLDVRSSQTAQTEPHYLGPSSTFAFSHIVNSSLCRNLPDRTYPPSGLLTNRVSSSSLCSLPDKQLALQLSNAYFQNIHPQYPFLHEPTFRIWEREATARPGEGGHVNISSIPLFFVNMVYSVGALLFPNYQSLAEELYTSAQLYTDVLSLENLETIQALLCYAMYSLRSPVGPSLWKITGLALRQCIELGYHRKSKALQRTSNTVFSQMRIRAFWSAYSIECMVSMWLGRPQSIALHEISAEFPTEVEPQPTDNGSRSDPSNAVHVFRLRCLWAQIYQSLYSGSSFSNEATRASRIKDLRGQLDHWLATAPLIAPRTSQKLSIFSTRAWYELNYNYTILHLHRLQLAEAQTESREAVFSDCLKAAKHICTQYRRLYVGTSVRHTWGTLHCIFFAGLAYLHCLWTAPGLRESIDEVSKTCTDATMVLVVIAQSWEEGAPYRDLFNVLANRTMTMMTGRLNDRGNSLPENQNPLDMDAHERDSLTHWMTDIANTGMSEEMENLLAGFMDEFVSFDASPGG